MASSAPVRDGVGQGCEVLCDWASFQLPEPNCTIATICLLLGATMSRYVASDVRRDLALWSHHGG